MPVSLSGENYVNKFQKVYIFYANIQKIYIFYANIYIVLTVSYNCQQQFCFHMNIVFFNTKKS